MSFIRAALAPEKRGADPSLPWGSSYIPTNGQLGLSASGVPINDDAALSISIVYRCVQILADSVSTLPLNGYKRTDDRTKVGVKHPLIQRPWPDRTIIDFLAQVVFSLALRGNFYGYITSRDAKGYATSIVPIHPDRVMAVRRDRFGNPSQQGRRTYRIDGSVVNTDDVLHIPSSMVPPGGFVGLNPVEYMRQSWSLAAAAEKYGGQFFANSAMPSVAITVPGDLSPEETTEMARQWTSLHGGIGNAHFPAVLTGDARITPISITPEDAQFLATRQFQRHEIYSWFGIPSTMAGDQDRSTSISGIEQEQMMFVTNTLLPYLVRIEQYLSDLLPPSISVKFDLSKRLRADTLQRYQAYQLGRNSGFLSVNDIRSNEDLPDIPKGDGYLEPQNMRPLGSPVITKKGPTNESGLGGGGGNPDNSPKETTPDSVAP